MMIKNINIKTFNMKVSDINDAEYVKLIYLE